MTHARSIGLPTATLLVVATMVGTGVFTTTGYLIQLVGSAWLVLLLWALGGVSALCGALCYAELSTMFPANGADYHLLTRIYHPALGFVAGWISLVVGFAAPVAGTALAFGAYLGPVAPGLNPTLSGLVLVVSMSLVHALDVRSAAGAQNAVTLPKVVLVALFALMGVLLGEPSRLASGLGPATGFGAAGVGLVMVYYAYSGWNGAVYVAGEVSDPGRNLPRSLFWGTAMVTLLYVALNAGFLAAAPATALAGKANVATVAAEHLLGDWGAKLVSGVIALGLVSAVGAMIMAGPRVYAEMGQDYRALRLLSFREQGRGPLWSIVLQGVLTVVLMLTLEDIDVILTYAGLTLSMSAGLTVFGLFVLRWREPELTRPFRTPAYPVPPVVFCALMVWMAVNSIRERPIVAAWSAATIASGFLIYALVARSRTTAGTSLDQR